MIALDTNVVVRLIVNDDPAQVRAARELVLANDVVVTTSVVLETEWVLRGAYGFDSQEIGRALKAFFSVEQVALAEPNVVWPALSYQEQGLDFADAVHLAAATEVGRIATFDRKLGKAARKLLIGTEVIELPSGRG